MPDEREARPDLPTGTVTFLRTDVEGSMALARTLGSAWDAINATHLGIMRDAVDRHRGVCVRTEGDALFAVFPEAGAALLAAIDGQHGLNAYPWPRDAPVRVRMGLHTGEAHLAGDDYGGFDVNRAARIAAVGHGGQIVVSRTTEALVATSLPSGVMTRDLGRHALKDVPVPEHLFQLDVPGLRVDFPPLRVAETTIGNLPERLTSFVGRTREIDELHALLDGSRLVTLTGPGGIGKTSLAVELARHRAGMMTDGAWFVALDSVVDPEQVGAVIARTLGLFDGSERTAVEALPGFLAGRSMLLVLDNFEQVLGAAGQAAAMLRGSPGTRLIVTSRAPLHVGGEQEYAVRPLTTGDAADPPGDGVTDDSAATLFVERGRAVHPGWDPGPDRPVIVEICALLDGLPLGIELAAARLSILPARAIRDRLAARLPLPGSGPRDAPARQRTLEGTIDWSHELLTPDERSVLHRLAVFEGGFDLAQAERVVAADGVADPSAVLDRLVALADQALIARDVATGDDGGHLEATGIRFAMLKTVQAYALARLTEDGRESDVHRRHAAAFLDLAEVAAVHLNTARQPPWLDRLSADLANLRGALRWAVGAGESEIALRMVAALWRFWLVDGRLNEGAEQVAAVFAMPGADVPSLARSRALAAAGGIAYWQGDRAAALRWYGEQLDVAAGVGDRPGIADAYYNLSSATYLKGDPGRSIECAETARRLFEELGDERGVNRVEWGLANVMAWTHEAQAIGEFERILAKAEALDDSAYVALAAGSLAWRCHASGDPAAAGRWAIVAMMGVYGMRDVASTTITLPEGAIMALGRGRPSVAATLMGAFEGLCGRYGVRPPPGLGQMIESADPLSQARAALGEAAADAAVERGRRMTLDEAMELIVGLGVDVDPGRRSQ